MVSYPSARRSSPGIQGCIHRSFYDQFIVDMANDKAMGKGSDGIHQNIAADCLDNVFHKFRTVTFDSFPFLCRTNTFVSDRFTAKLVFTDLRLYIGEGTSGWKSDE